MIYVVDSADKARIEVAKQELDLMLQERRGEGAPSVDSSEQARFARSYE